MLHKIFVHIRPLKRDASSALERVRDGPWHTSNIPDGIRPVRESTFSLQPIADVGSGEMLAQGIAQRLSILCVGDVDTN